MSCPRKCFAASRLDAPTRVTTTTPLTCCVSGIASGTIEAGGLSMITRSNRSVSMLSTFLISSLSSTWGGFGGSVPATRI